MRVLGRFLLFAGIAVPLGWSKPAGAQAAVYGEVGVTNYGYTTHGGSLTYGSDRVGGMAGGYYNFPIQSRATVGVDAHAGFGLHTNTGVKASAALRVGFVPQQNPLRPYLEIGGGIVSAHLPSESINTGALELALGLDVRVSSSLDWRAIELESAAGGGTRNAGSASVSTGIVYHFPSRRGQHT